jgi:hypothetical protein
VSISNLNGIILLRLPEDCHKDFINYDGNNKNLRNFQNAFNTPKDKMCDKNGSLRPMINLGGENDTSNYIFAFAIFKVNLCYLC